jgi:HEAT repeat protein
MARARSKTRGTEAKLAALRGLRDQEASPALVAELRKALGDTSNLVVAEAAEIIAAKKLAELAPDLVAAFDRFLIDPEETDKVCRAKNAIIETLHKLDHADADVFVRGIRHIQKEAAWGKPVDTAINVRANSAFALARIGHAGLLVLLADLLVDEEKAARVAAVQALGASGRTAAVPLLRFKARIGDEEPEVTAACLTGLLTLAPAESVSFVGTFLGHDDDAVQEGAAFALAESRRPEALPLLKDAFPRLRSRELQEIFLLAISMLRLPAAIDFLLEVVTGEDQAAALAALSALAIHRHNERVTARIQAAVEKANDRALAERFRAKFDAAEG